MLKIFLSIIALFYFCEASSQTISEGKIVYKVEKSAQYMQNLKEKAIKKADSADSTYIKSIIDRKSNQEGHIIYFKGDKIWYEYARTIRTQTIEDRLSNIVRIKNNNREEIIISTLVGKATIFHRDGWNKLPKKWGIMNKIKHDEKDTKMIAGYLCERAFVEEHEEGETKTIIYYTKEIPNVNVFHHYANLKGFPMYIEFSNGLTYTVVSVSAELVPDSQFEIPPHYKISIMEE